MADSSSTDFIEPLSCYSSAGFQWLVIDLSYQPRTSVDWEHGNVSDPRVWRRFHLASVVLVWTGLLGMVC